MIQGKPSLIFGNDRPEAPLRTGRSGRTGQSAGPAFASFLPEGEAPAPDQKAVPRAAGGAPPAESRSAPSRPGLSAAALQAGLAAAGREMLSPLPRSGRGSRLTGRPVTGRNGIGMEDSRKTARSGVGMEDSRKTARSGVGMEDSRKTAASAGRPGSYGQSAALSGFLAKREYALPAFTAQDASSPLKKPSPGKSAPGGRRRENPPRPDRSLPEDRPLQAASREKGGGPQAVLSLSSLAQAPLDWIFSRLERQASPELGDLAARFESGSEGVAAIGYDRNGGTSYGKFQISSRAGTMSSFLRYLESAAPDLAGRLTAAGPANTGGRSGKMPEVWKRIASEDPVRFERLQNDFICKSHFEPALQDIEENTGLRLEKIPPALQEVIFSTAVQHGPGGAARIVSRALSKVGKNAFNAALESPDKLRRAGESLIKHIYAIRAGQFGSSTQQVQAAARERLHLEMREALSLLS